MDHEILAEAFEGCVCNGLAKISHPYNGRVFIFVVKMGAFILIY
jgi:hypothetical protein